MIRGVFGNCRAPTLYGELSSLYQAATARSSHSHEGWSPGQMSVLAPAFKWVTMRKAFADLKVACVEDTGNSLYRSAMTWENKENFGSFSAGEFVKAPVDRLAVMEVSDDGRTGCEGPVVAHRSPPLEKSPRRLPRERSNRAFQ